MENEAIHTSLRAVAEFSGNFTNPDLAARHAASYCQLDANGRTVPIDSRSSLATVLQRVAAEHPEVAKAAPASGNLVTDAGVLNLIAEDTSRRKSVDALRSLFGRGSDARAASALMRSNPGEYRRLRALAVAANLL